MNLQRIFLSAACLAFCFVPAGHANAVPPLGLFQSQQAPSVTPSTSVPAGAVESPPATAQRITKYTLPPDRYRKARNLGKIHFRFALISFVYGLVVLCLVLRWKLAVKYRTLAEKKFSKPFLQAVVFSPLIILTIEPLPLATP